MKKIASKSFDIVFFLNTFSLKRELLYFDEIYFNEATFNRNAKIGEFLSSTFRQDNGNLHEWILYEVETLKKEGLLIPFQPVEINSYEECCEFRQQTEIFKLSEKMRVFERKTRKCLKKLLSKGDDRLIGLECLMQNTIKHGDIKALLIARSFNFKKSGCVPLMNGLNSEIKTDSLYKQSLIANIIVQDFPYLCVTTDWSEILNHKSDPKNKEYLSALKNWVIDISKSDLTRDELIDKLNYFKHEYIQHSQLLENKIY